MEKLISNDEDRTKANLQTDAYRKKIGLVSYGTSTASKRTCYYLVVYEVYNIV